MEAADQDPSPGSLRLETQAEMFANRLRKRYRHLAKWAKRRGAGFFRLYDRDIPEIPLVLDFYGSLFPKTAADSGETADPRASASQDGRAALAGALYKRPYEKDEAEERLWLARMRAAASAALDIPESRVFIKERKPQRGMDQYEKFGGEHAGLKAREGGLKFWVNLSDYLDTGIFPDRRLLRAKIREEAAGKRILNLFAYTCSLSVYAAAGKAAGVDSVDLSNTYLDWGRRNFALNGLEDGGPKEEPSFRFIRADVFHFLAEKQRQGKTWDLIVLDPPTFSNSKKMERTLDVRRDHRELIEGCLALLAPGGRLWLSVNARAFKLAERDFPGLTLIDMTEKLRDEDFRNRRIPVCYVFEKGN
ncbi:MAG: class I SAM-dependent methyltransferase [Treponema sp.]|jgi:23S rRNA G2069 N7-methylase RlmK/C1962 C5-methylase RlmI|nr:class I SAM-dependent methyltransferase [Treponema sp.]